MRVSSFVSNAAAIGAWLLMIGAAVLPAAAQEASPPAVQAPVQVGSTQAANAPLPWTVNCSSNPQTGELACSMTQVLVAQDTQQRLIGASVYRDTSGAAIMRISPSMRSST